MQIADILATPRERRILRMLAAHPETASDASLRRAVWLASEIKRPKIVQACQAELDRRKDPTYAAQVAHTNHPEYKNPNRPWEGKRLSSNRLGQYYD